MNMSVPSEWQVLVSLSTDKTVKLLSHVVNITVHSLSITWCNLYCNSLDDSYCILKCRKAVLFMYAIYPFQKYKTWDIDCKRLFRNVWIIEDMVDLPIFSCTLQPASAIVRPWLTAWSTTVALISSDMHLCPWPLLPLPLFCICTLPPCILPPLLPLGCWPWWFPGCSSIVRICNSCVVLCLYMLSNWRFMRCTFELFQRTGLYGLIYILLVQVKIHLDNSWQIYKKSKRNL